MTNITDSTFTWANSDKYVGQFKDDKYNGQGTFTWTDGEYVGPPKDGKKNGQGTYTYASGDKYVGQYQDGKKRQGTLDRWRNYVGDWKDNELHGQGTYTYGGDKYVGRGDKKTDDAFTFSNGNKYVGQFKDDKYNGQGTFTWANGDKYVGEFRDDKRNGQGTFTFSNGTVKEGIWKDGVFQYAQELSPSAPKVTTPNKKTEIISASSGSGFAVSPDGYVITNHHVIDGCEKVVVHIKGKELPVTVVTYDPQNDLALLKGDFSPKTVFPLSNNRPELLQDIYVAGYPFGDKFSTAVKVTKGIISSLTGLGNNFSNIQIDAALQSGNSGGPILDDLGNVVAVAVAKLDAVHV